MLIVTDEGGINRSFKLENSNTKGWWYKMIGYYELYINNRRFICKDLTVVIKEIEEYEKHKRKCKRNDVQE